MKRLAVFLIIFILLPASFLRAEEIALNLEEAVLIGLRDNRDVLLEAEEVKKAKFKIEEAKAGLYPSLNFTSSQAYSRGLYAKEINQFSTQTTLKQYLYKGGKTVNTIEQNEYEFAVAQALLDKAKLDTRLNIVKTFYTLQLAKEFVDLNKFILENTQRHLNFVQARYKSGQASGADLLQIKASWGNVRQAYEGSLNQFASGQALLANLLYLDKDIQIKPSAAFIYEPKEMAYDLAFLIALQTRPEIRQYEAQEKSDQKAIEITKSDNRPSVYASWDYYSRSATSSTVSPAKGWQDYNIVGVTFSWPIFDGWATKAKVEQAILDLKITQTMKEKAIKDIALELRNAYVSLKNAVAKIKAVEVDTRFYKDSFLTVKEKYRQGQLSRLDVDDTYLKYSVSIFNKKQAIYDYIIAKANFNKATGGM